MESLLTFSYSGVIVNTLTVMIGSLLGMTLKKNIPEKYTNGIMTGLGLCSIYIGIAGALNAGSDVDANPVMPIIAIALGVLMGTILDIDGKLMKIGELVERKFSKQSKGKISEGFISACLLFCVGSMTIVGGINAGILGDNTLYFTKSVLDFVSSIVLSVSYGLGVFLSSIFVFVFQGSIVLASTLIGPLLTSHMIAEMNCVGNLLIVLIGFNLMGITKIRVADFLPSILIALIMAIFI